MTRLKTITSKTGLVRWKRETRTVGYLARCQVPEEVFPKQHTAYWVPLFDWQGTPCICLEIEHQQYGVYAIPTPIPCFTSAEDAINYHCDSVPAKRAS